MVDAVLFDLFETLASQFESDHESTSAWLARNLPVDEAAIQPLWRGSRPQRERGAYGDFPAYLRALCRDLDVPVNEGLIQRLHAERLARKRQILMRVEDDVIEVLTRLREMGLRLAVVSNCDPEDTVVWADCALAPLFDATVFSHEVGVVKPEPEIFLATCRRLGAAPERCVFVGDGGGNELRGAAAVGMHPLCAAWYLPRYGEFAAPGALKERARGFPQLRHVGEVVTQVERLSASNARGAG
jgi:putative hydrolase of the HAD superfamily